MPTNGGNTNHNPKRTENSAWRAKCRNSTKLQNTANNTTRGNYRKEEARRAGLGPKLRRSTRTPLKYFGTPKTGQPTCQSCYVCVFSRNNNCKRPDEVRAGQHQRAVLRDGRVQRGGAGGPPRGARDVHLRRVGITLSNRPSTPDERPYPGARKKEPSNASASDS